MDFFATTRSYLRKSDHFHNKKFTHLTQRTSTSLGNTTSNNFYTTTISSFGTINNKTDRVFGKTKNFFGHSYAITQPNLQEADYLSKYYKTSKEDTDEYDFLKVHKKRTTDEQKELKRALLSKYRISHRNIPNRLPLIEDPSVTVKVVRPYFKNIEKAGKVLDINRQIANTKVEIGNIMQIEKYNNNIEDIEMMNYYISKMPKVRIKKIDLHNKQILDNEVKEFNKSNKKEDDNNQGKRRFSLAAFIREANAPSLANGLPQHVADLNKMAINIFKSKINMAFKPVSRSFFTVTQVGKAVYLFGGLNAKYNKDIWMFDIQHKKWKNIPLKEDPVPRYGHTAVKIMDNVIIYGGVTPRAYFKTAEEVLIFNTTSKMLYTPKILGKVKPGFRKGHIALGISQSMLIQGGFDIDRNEMKNSSYIYHPGKSIWSELDCTGEPLPYLMYHSAAVVNDYSRVTINPYSIYRLPEDLPSNRIKKIKIEGVYLFGGINDKKVFSNDVYIIKICRKPCKCIKARINGSPPLPRINCQMQYIIEYNLLVIHGGEGESQEAFNDVMILNTETLNWIRPVMEEDDPDLDQKLLSRTEHGMFFNNGKFYVFGGRENEKYLKMDFEVITFHISQ